MSPLPSDPPPSRARFWLCWGGALGVALVVLVGGGIWDQSAATHAFPWGARSPAPRVTARPVVPPSRPQSLPITARLHVKGHRINLEVARSWQEQQIGLMFRTELAADRGMLFPFAPARPVKFWMKNTLIPLDMIFLRAGQVRAVLAQVPPCRTDPCPGYGPEEAIDAVLELRAGRAAELGIRVGDRLVIESLPE